MILNLAKSNLKVKIIKTYYTMIYILLIKLIHKINTNLKIEVDKIVNRLGKSRTETRKKIIG